MPEPTIDERVRRVRAAIEQSLGQGPAVFDIADLTAILDALERQQQSRLSLARIADNFRRASLKNGLHTMQPQPESALLWNAIREALNEHQ